MLNGRRLKILLMASIFVVLFVLTMRLHPHRHVWRKFLSKSASHFYKIHAYSSARKNTSKSMNGCSMVSLHQLESAKTTKNNIPLIFHQIYIYETDDVPIQYVPLIQGCRKVNHDLIYLFWTMGSAEFFIKEFYPEYLALYQRYSQNVMKADFVRVLILYHFGGIYADMDMECRKPFSRHIDKFKENAIIDQERNLQTRLLHNINFTAMNSVLIARKKHPFFKYLLSRFHGNIGYYDVLYKTGPFLLRAAFIEYERQNRAGKDEVHLASPSWFSPLVDSSAIHSFNTRCVRPYDNVGEIRRLGCLEWDRQGRNQDNIESIVKNSVLVHKFLHLAYDKEASYVQRRVNICKSVNIFEPLLI